MKTFAIVMGAMFAMSSGACGGKKEEGGGGGGEGGGGDLPATCKKYVDTMKACLEKLPDAARTATEDAFNQTTKAWSDAAKQGADAAAALEAGCKSAWDAAKGSMGAMCPDVKWE
jgi:hypothetical protein